MTKDKNKGLITLMIVVVFIIAGGFLAVAIFQPDDATSEINMNQDFLHPPINPQASENSSLSSTKIGDSFQGRILAGNRAPLLDFVKEDYQQALKSDKLIVLYFFASWCPICKKEVNEALVPAFNDLNRDDVIGFRVNFNDNDTNKNEKELAKEFGVVYQHTKVFLKNGERVLKSPESWEKGRYGQEIEKALTK